MREQVEKALDKVRTMLMADGGNVELVDVSEDGVVKVRLTGEEADFNRGTEYLTSCGVKIQPLSQDIIRNETKCTDCGVCVPICPTGALVIDPHTRKVHFYDNKCIACELCVKVCPTRAMEIHF